jgi:uncharacterized membrane protein (DUF485 family)
MLHEPAGSSEPDYAAHYKMRLGFRMFIVYSIFYASFVGLNLYSPLLMERTVVFGLNLATVYGVSLILVALIQALIYDLLCRRRENSLNGSSVKEKGS